MYLRRLELQGYKTFALPTTFEFNAGITAIVGPNGSGKSNIADAIRWVLGEQSYSNLRAKKTEDIIFAGSRTRARMGMAQVTMTLDNSDRWLPVDFSEVTVTRRAYRSGENEYMLNGSKVRLKDIVEILAKGGLGQNTYVVIGQGLVDAALSLNPSERRSLFEEAAGIKIYLNKREEALRKLEETRRNMVRVNDIINEIAPRLKTLERQAKRVQEHNAVLRDLKEMLQVWYGYQWKQRTLRFREIEAQVKEQMRVLGEQKAKLSAVASQLEQIREQRRILLQKQEEWQRARQEITARLEAVRRQLAVGRERQQQFCRQASELHREVESLESRSAVIAQAIAQAQAEISRLSQQHEKHRAEADHLKARLEELRAERDTLHQELEMLRRESSQVEARIASASSERHQLASRRTEIHRDQEEHDRLITQHRERVAEVNERISQVQVMLSEAQQRMRVLNDDLKRVEKERADSLRCLTDLETQLSEAERRLKDLIAHREMLAGIRNELAGYNPGIKEILERKKEIPGILSTVASLLSVPEELERAIEAALDRRLQDIIVEDWESAEEGIALLDRLQAGRVTFLPLASPKRPHKASAPKLRGVLGLASDLTDCPSEYAQAFERLLGSILIVEDLATAKKVFTRYANSFRSIVTKAGQIVAWDGSLTGGSQPHRTSLLAQEREWRELPERIAAATERIECLRREHTDEQQKHQTIEEQMAKLAERLDSTQQQIRTYREEIADLRQRRAALAGEIEWRQSVRRQLDEEVSALSQKEEALAQRIASEERAKADLDQRIATLQQRIETIPIGGVRQRLSELETSIAVTLRSMESQQVLLNNHRENLAQLKRQVEEKRRRAEQLESDSKALEAKIQAWQDEESTLQGQLDALISKLEPARTDIQRLERERDQLLDDELSLRSHLRHLESRFNQSVLEKDRLNDELQALIRQIEEDLGAVEVPTDTTMQLRLDLGGESVKLAAPSVLPQDLERKIRETRSRLRRLSPINPDALDEHQRVLTRFNFLKTQIADLEKAASSLHDVVKELDQIIETRFRKTFEAVAAEFGRYFTLLFGGGTARLIMSDPDDIATTGVEIIARPPGRRLQNLSLLSGGERALTATALLFALLKVNPIPFCLLDEVDAMLDEANVGRFREVLQDLSDRTQFIVITHNRQTVEAAHIIYGISMGEDGVSRVISLKLPEEQQKETQLAEPMG